MSNVIIVSGDGHIGGQPEDYRPYLEAEFRDRIDELQRENDEYMSVLGSPIKDRLTPEQFAAVDTDGVVAGGGEFGCWDAEMHVRQMDREGISAAVLHAGHQCSILPFFSVMNEPYPADLRAAGFRAYHRWAADFMAHAPGRLVGVADPGTSLDFDETRAELTWCREHGFVAVSLPQQVWDDSLPAIHDPYYEPFWQICDDLGLTLSVHAGWGSPQGKFQEFGRAFLATVVGADPEEQKKLMMRALGQDEESPLQLDMGPRRVLWQLMLGGVFDRHPDVSLALTEIRADWLPGTLASLDDLATRLDTPLKKKPSEYFAEHCFVTPSSIHQCEIDRRHEIGVANLMFGTDYPHPEGTWPNTLDWIRLSFGAVPEAEARAILGENAIRAYGLDRAILTDAAERIGPAPSDVLGDFSVPPERVAHWNSRAGYSRDAEQPDVGVIAALFDEDLQATTSN